MVRGDWQSEDGMPCVVVKCQGRRFESVGNERLVRLTVEGGAAAAKERRRTRRERVAAAGRPASDRRPPPLRRPRRVGAAGQRAKSAGSSPPPPHTDSLFPAFTHCIGARPLDCVRARRFSLTYHSPLSKSALRFATFSAFRVSTLRTSPSLVASYWRTHPTARHDHLLPIDGSTALGTRAARACSSRSHRAQGPGPSLAPRAVALHQGAAPTRSPSISPRFFSSTSSARAPRSLSRPLPHRSHSRHAAQRMYRRGARHRRTPRRVPARGGRVRAAAQAAPPSAA